MSKEYRRFSIRSNNPRQMINSQKLVRTYQPTYQLNPKKRFDAEQIQKILQRVVSYELNEVEYSEKQIPELCLSLAETLRNAIKEENYNRYRIIVMVSIGQRRQQSVHIFHSFLWDHERDAFATFNYENCHLFANVVVYGVYLD
ncbi:dynein light chain Tctex-type 5-A-like isoform X1 [Galleria mellonella]|uniref:Dynein light chain Tctex-type 5-A-like isoform X1 n=1 Tax=Galleria mellonella TaxID=7137 RepID=A0A6J1X2H0_GALME|nr:dynein light chain Tctex-type 5-A-like isoform X1 [Galleria mellonella]